MPPHQLPVSIALSALAVCSLAYLVFSRPREGKIKLPERDEGEDSVHDPFDVTTPEDIIDGEPIGAPEFWRRVSCSYHKGLQGIDSQ